MVFKRFSLASAGSLGRFAILALAISVAGCGESGPPTARVSGKVTYNGKPVKGNVSFGGVKGSETGVAAIDEDGSYECGRAPVGNADVIVTPMPPPPKKGKPPFPEKYTKPGTLKFTIKSGSNTFDVNMQ